MKKKVIIIICISVLVLAGIAVGVFFFIKGQTFKTEESAVYVKKNGKIIEAGIEEFDTSVYEEAELESFINKEVEGYNATIGEERIKVQEVLVENNIATMYLEYASAEDYEAFHGETFFAGSFKDALETGYLTDMEFYSVYDETVGASVTLGEVTGEELKVVIMEERMGIHVKGTIVYISKNLELIDKDTVSLLEDVQDVENYIVVIYK